MPRLDKSKKLSWELTPETKKKETFTKDETLIKFYNSTAWKKARRAHRRGKPLCKHCQDKGITKLAEEVDHIKPISQGGDKLDPNNLQSLCKSCHSRKSATERKSRS